MSERPSDAPSDVAALVESLRSMARAATPVTELALTFAADTIEQQQAALRAARKEAAALRVALERYAPARPVSHGAYRCDCGAGIGFDHEPDCRWVQARKAIEAHAGAAEGAGNAH